jgi:hypothetical protein
MLFKVSTTINAKQTPVKQSKLNYYDYEMRVCSPLRCLFVCLLGLMKADEGFKDALK